MKTLVKWLGGAGIFVAILAVVFYLKLEDQISEILKKEIERSTPVKIKQVLLDLEQKNLLVEGKWETLEFVLRGRIQLESLPDKRDQIRVIWTPEIQLQEKRLKAPSGFGEWSVLLDWKARKLLSLQMKGAFEAIQWEQSSDQIISVSKPQWKFDGNFSENIPNYGLDWSWSEAEILWGDFYLEDPFKGANYRLRYGRTGVELQVGEELSIQAKGWEGDRLFVKSRWSRKGIRWENREWRLTRADILLEAEGFFSRDQWTQPSQWVSSLFHQMNQGDLKLRLILTKGAIGSKASGFLVEGVKVSALWDQDHWIEISAKDLWFRKLHGVIQRTRIPFKKDSQGVWVGKTQGPWGLVLNGPYPMRWNDLEVRIGAEASIHSGLSFEAWELEKVVQDLCLTRKPVPPVKLSLSLPLMELTKRQALFQGEALARLFEGEIRVRDLALFDLWTEVPEIQFSAQWDRISLEEFGRWSGFGRMEGTLNGYWRDVVFQYWLPTEYDFFVQGMPLQGEDKIVFSPEAMRNFVRLFAGDELDRSLPGIAEWLAFGWPSRIFGGYDVYFVGLKALAQNGSILVETLDPEQVPGVCKKAGNHFILCGPRFKIPLQSVHYPVVLDSPAVANLTRHVMRQVEGLKMAEKNEKEILREPKPVENSCLPDHPFFHR